MSLDGIKATWVADESWMRAVARLIGFAAKRLRELEVLAGTAPLMTTSVRTSLGTRSGYRTQIAACGHFELPPWERLTGEVIHL